MPFKFFRKKPRQLPATPSPASSRSVVYAIGEKIAGKYEVIKAFEGGLGRVYIVRNGNDELALKTNKFVSDAVARAAFVREAQAWVAVGRHPNILPAYWVDDVAGLLCVATKAIEPDGWGRVSMRDFIRRGRITAQQIVRWAAEFSYGMTHARERGLLVHRDIKPENLLIGDSGRLQIADFGLATTAGQLGASGIGGTPAYMPPEQWIGKSKEFATDIYAFGVVLHELAFGRTPWSANTIDELRDAHINQKPIVGQHPLQKVIQTCLEKRVGDRFQNPAEFFVALSADALVAGVAVPPRPVPGNDARDELMAVASLNIIGDRKAALRAVQQIVDRWPDDQQAWTQLGRLLKEEGQLDEAEDATRRSLQIDPTRSAPWNNLGLLLENRGAMHESVEAFKRALDADPDNTGAMANIASPLCSLHREGEAIPYLREATTLAPDKVIGWVGLAQVFWRLRMATEASEAIRSALALSPPANIRDLLRSLQNEVSNADDEGRPGVRLLVSGDVQSAVPLLKADVAANPSDAVALQNLAVALIETGADVDARDALLALHRVEPANQFAWMHLMKVASKAGDVAEAEKWCDMFASVPGLVGRSKAFRAYIVDDNDKPQLARQLLHAAMRDHPDEPDVFIANGDIAMKRRVPGYAVNAYRQALTILRNGPHEIEQVRSVEAKLSDAVAAARREAFTLDQNS